MMDHTFRLMDRCEATGLVTRPLSDARASIIKNHWYGKWKGAADFRMACKMKGSCANIKLEKKRSLSALRISQKGAFKMVEPEADLSLTWGRWG